MNPDVSIKSIEFQTDLALSSVKVNLSNGQSSPVFENSDHHPHHFAKTITFDPNTPIRAVSARDIKDYTGNIKFLDSRENELYSYNPGSWRSKTVTHQIAENEELIGVYGVKDKEAYLTSFGFIVKVKKE